MTLAQRNNANPKDRTRGRVRYALNYKSFGVMASHELHASDEIIKFTIKFHIRLVIAAFRKFHVHTGFHAGFDVARISSNLQI